MGLLKNRTTWDLHSNETEKLRGNFDLFSDLEVGNVYWTVLFYFAINIIDGMLSAI